MADAKPAAKVRYRVLAPCFVNGSLADPTGRKEPLFVMAAEGLEGRALKLEPEVERPRPPAPAAKAGP